VKFKYLSNIILYHGIVAFAFVVIFLLEAFSVALPLSSLEAQHPNFVTSEYTKALCLFATVGTRTFALYEVFFLPSFLKRKADDASRRRLRTIFVGYPIHWCVMVTYIALMEGTAWNAWISVGVMYGFTILGYRVK